MGEDESASDIEPCCPHCFAPIQEGVHFCPRCERPLTGFAATDPIQSIRTEGQLYRGATRTTRPIVVVGMWLLCVPALFMGAAVLSERGEDLAGALVITILVFALYGTILYRVTANYLRARKEARTSHEGAL